MRVLGSFFVGMNGNAFRQTELRPQTNERNRVIITVKCTHWNFSVGYSENHHLCGFPNLLLLRFIRISPAF